MDSLLNTDSMKEFVDLGTGIVNILAKIVDVAGGGGTAILAIGSALTTLFSKQIGAEINNIPQDNSMAKICRSSLQGRISTVGILHTQIRTMQRKRSVVY